MLNDIAPLRRARNDDRSSTKKVRFLSVEVADFQVERDRLLSSRWE